MRKGIIAAVLLAALPLGAFASDGAADGAPVPGAGTKSIVVYFSATGNTKAAAEKIAKLTGSEIMEIEPAEKYTDADLNWHDGESRSSVEMNDESSRGQGSEGTLHLCRKAFLRREEGSAVLHLRREPRGRQRETP